MFRKILAFALVGLSLNLLEPRTAYATDSNEEKEARFTQRVKEGIDKLGTGSQARVEITLRDKTKLKGYIHEANPKSFTIMDENAVATEIGYREVKQVRGKNRSKNVWVLIAVGIVIGVIILIATVGAGDSK